MLAAADQQRPQLEGARRQGLLHSASSGHLRQRGGGEGGGVRLRLGGGLRGGVLLPHEVQSGEGGDAVHSQAQQDLLALAGGCRPRGSCRSVYRNNFII